MLRISSNIAAKVSLKSGDERLLNEQQVFDSIGPSGCPYIISCYFHAADVSFVEFVANGTLHDRLSMSRPRPILRWMLQLSYAVACLEHSGLAHGDINPQNILFNDADEVKLIDFDHSLKIGDSLDVGYEPYVRQHRKLTGGLYGVAGPVTEQFALGSVFWYMSRGSQLYSELEGPDQVDRLLDGILPYTDPRNVIDCIIRNCWAGSYAKVVDIVEDIKDAMGSDLQAQDTITQAERKERSLLCQEYCRMATVPYNPSETVQQDCLQSDEGSYVRERRLPDFSKLWKRFRGLLAAITGLKARPRAQSDTS